MKLSCFLNSLPEQQKKLVVALIALVAALLVIVAVFFIFLKIKTASRRRKVQAFGKESEERIDKLLKEAFGEEAVFSGVFLPYVDEKEKYAEIDHIVINRSGVFVIEVKSHNGFIHNPDTHDWWQTYNDKKLRFYNPIRQNATHVKILNRLFRKEGQYLDRQIHNIVVFTSHRVNFSQKYDQLISPQNALIPYIRRKGQRNVLSSAQVSRLRRIVTENSVKDKRIAHRHRKHIRNYQ